jgi:hypothetical protein
MEPELSSNDAQSPPATTGRRAAPRLRLAIPARFVSIYATQRCVLIDLSRTGARMALATLVAPGQAGYLEIDRMEIFGTVVRAQRSGEMAVNALAFDDPIPQAAVLRIRAYAEGLEARMQMALRDQVRRWVTGEA